MTGEAGRRGYRGGVDEREIERVEVDGMELHVEPVADDDRRVHTALPPKVESWRRRSVSGAILTGFAFGLREALEPEREEAPIVVQVSGEPVEDLAVEAHLDEGRPSESVVRVRPWLLADGDTEAADEGPDASGRSGGTGPGAPVPAGDPPGTGPGAPGPAGDQPGR